MSCVVLTDPQCHLLAALTAGPRPTEQLDRSEVEVLRRWGWVFGQDWVELTGAGHYHAGNCGGWAGGQGLRMVAGQFRSFRRLGGRDVRDDRAVGQGAVPRHSDAPSSNPATTITAKSSPTAT